MGLLGNLDMYFATLVAYRPGQPLAINELFVLSALNAVDRDRWLATELTTPRDQPKDDLAARGGALVWRLIPLLPQRPALPFRILADKLSRTQVKSRIALEPLKCGVLGSATVYKRIPS